MCITGKTLSHMVLYTGAKSLATFADLVVSQKSTATILIVDPNIFDSFKFELGLSPNVRYINQVHNTNVVLIDTWQELCDLLLATIRGNCEVFQGSSLIGIYGLIKYILNVNSITETTLFIGTHRVSAQTLNHLFSLLYNIEFYCDVKVLCAEEDDIWDRAEIANTDADCSADDPNLIPISMISSKWIERLNLKERLS